MTVKHAVRTPLWRRKAVVVLAIVGALLGAVLGAAQGSASSATYQAAGTSFVTFTFPPEEKDPFSAAQFVTQRIDTYAQLGESPEVLQSVAADVGLRVGDVTTAVKVSALPGTVLLSFTATAADPDTAVRLANSLMTNLGRAAAAVEAGNNQMASPISLVRVQPPLVGPASSTKTLVMFAVVGIVIGIVLGAGLGWIVSIASSARRRTRSANLQPGRHRGPGTPNGEAP